MALKTLGERVRDERKLRGMIQEELAKIFGVSKVIICFLEKGIERFPSHQFLYKISQFLGEDFLALINSEIAWMEEEIEKLEAK